MRVVVVSAHYPPNFISGGTLQPQRLARGLRARGHDVSVYAGWLGDRQPLSSWEDRDETGLQVQWVVTTPWTGWSDRRNFDNPKVARHFAEYLDHVRPDVVHLHSLQSLGAGLVSAAKGSGARVIVTMHDFWWVCARQFLVDRLMQPCSLVLEAGDCACEVSHAWAVERSRRLRAALRCADAVLAPSAVAVSVIGANGLVTAGLQVDENGVPEAPAQTTRPARNRSNVPLHAVYAGGPSEMKGAGVLLESLGHLAGRDDIHVTAYGWTEAVDGRGVAGRQFRMLPPFDPDQLDLVLGSADVLLLPSVMRESHSILTREALARRVPVIASDCLGPEEVIQHEVNGLLVPTNDAEALARALVRVASDQTLLDVLRDGCEGTSITSLAEQLDRLEAVYREAPTHRVRTTPRLRSVLFIVGIDGAPARYRAHLPAEALELLGLQTEVRHYRDPSVLQLAEGADAVVVYRVPATKQILALLGRLRERRIALLFDVDDLIFDPGIASEIPALGQLKGSEAVLWLEGVHRYRTTMEACDAYVGSTTPLCEHAERVTNLPAERFPNGVGIELGRYSDRALAEPRQAGPPRIGYFSGTTTHDADWAQIEGHVIDVLERRPDVELWIGGYLKTGPALEAMGDRVRRFQFLPWTDLPQVLRHLDINLAPLAPTGSFNDAKSAIKWLEAALVETVTVASPTPPFREVIRDRENGALAADGPLWTSTLIDLLDDSDLRERLGRRARRDVLLSLSPRIQGQRYLELLERTCESPRGPDLESGWTPIVKDEPWVPSPLVPYKQISTPHLRSDVDPLRRHAHRLVEWSAVARAMSREQGYRVTLRRATSFLRRRLRSHLSASTDH